MQTNWTQLRLCFIASVFAALVPGAIAVSEPAAGKVAPPKHRLASLPDGPPGRGPTGRLPEAMRPYASRQPLAFGDHPTVLHLDPGEDDARAAFVDSQAGFAYFAYSQDPEVGPAKIVKVRTSDLSRVATLELSPGESLIGSGAIDTLHGFAYVGTYTAPGSVVKIRLSDFSRVGSLALDPGENYLRTAVLDPSGEFAYFGTEPVSGPIDVVRIRLSDFSRSGALRLPAPASFGGTTATMDPQGISAYVTNGDTVYRIGLADFTVSGAWRPASATSAFTCSVVDPAGTYGYFANASSVSTLYKVRLSDLAELSEVSRPGVDWHTASVDPGGQFVYLGSWGGMTRVRLSDFTALETMAWNSKPGEPTAAVVDVGLGQLLVATWGVSSQIIRLKVPEFIWSGTLALRGGEDQVLSAVVDSSGGYAYFGTYTSPGMIVKVRLSDFKRVATLTLEPGEDGLTAAAIDPAGGYAYFGTFTDPGIVVKVRLSDFTRVGATTLGAGESRLVASTIDTSAGYVYFGTYTSPGFLVKMTLSDLARVGALDVTNAAGAVDCASATAQGGYAYVGIETAGSLAAVRVRLSDFTRDGILPLPNLYGYLSALLLDPAAGFGYVVSWDAPSAVTQIRLSDFTAAATLDLPDSAGLVSTGVIDSSGGWAYFASYGDLNLSSRVFRVRLSDFTNAGAIVPDDTPWIAHVNVGAIDPVTLFGYFATDGKPSHILKVDLGRPGLPTATVSGGRMVCPRGGGTIWAYLTGVPPWSVTWSDGAQYAGLTVSPHSRSVTVSGPTTYSITSVSDSSGAGTATGVATFSIFPPTPAPSITGPLSAFAGASGLMASVPPHPTSSYLWYGDSDAVITSGGSSSQIFFTAATNGPTILHASEFGPCPSPWADLVIPVQTATAPLALEPLVPCRILDTRNATGPDAASPALAAGADRILPIAGHCGVPSSAIAISVNATVTQPTGSGSLSFHAGNEPTNSSSALSFGAGQTRASNAIIRLASDGSATLGVQNNSPGTVHLILDVNGYFQ